ncbi:MAG: heparinase II/III family protein [Pirellulales bacterium]
MRLLKYYHTVRYLKPAQLFGRLWNRLPASGPDLRPAPPTRNRRGTWVSPSPHPRTMFGPRRFRFLNEEREIDSAEAWRDERLDLLWLYNLHYFEDLNSLGADDRRAWHGELVERWIRENPPGLGPGWHPYPLSQRIVHWIKAALAGQPLSEAALHSLAVQARYLSHRLETYLLGNHLLANAKALVFAGTFFSGEEAEQWRATGLRILAREIPEQVLPDGGHFERSSMYHGIILEDLLDLENLAAAYPENLPEPGRAAPRRWTEVIERMRRWLKTMCHPDGQIALFNDAAVGIACRPADLDAYAQRLGLAPVSEPAEGLTHLDASGYIRLQQGPAVAFLDVGPIGPDYLPAHAHADTLTFELSLWGRRFLVNSGTSCYRDDPQRQWERSTAAHNTVEVDRADSSEVWGRFRVARRARPRGLEIAAPPGGALEVSCAHDGYRRLPGRVVHRRTWRLAADRFDITDVLEGTSQSAVARFHLHPEVVPCGAGVSPAQDAPSSSLAFQHAGRTVAWSSPGAAGRLEPSTYHPEFGLSQPNLCLSVVLPTRKTVHSFSWC